jgi:hypothetical protein
MLLSSEHFFIACIHCGQFAWQALHSIHMRQTINLCAILREFRGTQSHQRAHFNELAKFFIVPLPSAIAVYGEFLRLDGIPYRGVSEHLIYIHMQYKQ